MSRIHWVVRYTIIISVFVPGRSRVVQTHLFNFCTALGRPGTKTEIIIVTINVTSSTTTPFQMKELVFCPIYRISVIETVLWFQSFKPLRK
jgi:hypothetical protein